MTAHQQAKAERHRSYRARLKIRQRHAITDAAVKRSEQARRLRAGGLAWKAVAQRMGLNSPFTARTVAMRNPTRQAERGKAVTAKSLARRRRAGTCQHHVNKIVDGLSKGN